MVLAGARFFIREAETGEALPARFSISCDDAGVPGAAQRRFSGALQTRDRSKLGIRNGPGSAVHRDSASKTRVNALVALHRVRDTPPAH